MTPPGGVRGVICRIAESSKATSKFDLEDKEGGALPAQRSKSSLLEGGVYAMGALAGDP